jgi:hypothetical protein
MSEYYSVPELLANTYWKDKRFDYAGGSNIIYMGVNSVSNADAGASTWFIYKLTYSGSDVTRVQGPLEGSWSNRASLSW